MTEQKHFKYEGRIDLSDKYKQDAKIDVICVEFLTPARVKLTVDGKETAIMVNVDIINRKVYDQSGSTIFTEAVFEHLDAVNTLPEDFFMAPEEISNAAAEIEDDRRRQTEEILGEQYGQ